MSNFKALNSKLDALGENPSQDQIENLYAWILRNIARTDWASVAANLYLDHSAAYESLADMLQEHAAECRYYA